MTKLSTIHPLPLAVGALFLISIAGIRVSAAADIAADPQQQAQRVLQPVHEVAAGGIKFVNAGRSWCPKRSNRSCRRLGC